MAKNGYELMFILDSNAYARNPAGAGETIQKMIESLDGEVQASRLWNEQKLAYPVRGRYKGTYWLTYFRLDGNRLTELNRACQLNDMVLRHLCVRIDERIFETLVAAAHGHTAGPESADDAEASDADAGNNADDGDKSSKNEPAAADA